MTAADNQSFEWLRARLDQQPHSVDDKARELIWADSGESLAVARNAGSLIEIFVVGPPLHATSSVLDGHLEHQTWTTSTGAALPATRIILPGSVNLPGVAAFICAELLANGLTLDPQTAFTATEPVIVQLMRHEAVGNQVLTGLAGELLALDALTRHASSPESVVDGWFGHAPSSRDFQLGPVGVEVKTTTGSSSTHTVQGFHQVEVGHPNGDEPETTLYVLSIGIRWLSTGTTSGRTIPSLVDAIVGRLPAGAGTHFLARLQQYGGDAGIGYDHEQDRDKARFARPWFATFERLYDMTDDRIHVLRSRDVQDVTHIDPASVSFRVTLPSQVNGDINPITGIEGIARSLTQ
ncbi:PD-(D/E)XK motif protein [Antribacter sp. KLBMP9083]|uniref:PD-(D/E)XK motif protein n=1 Tax=Antribacter soli TaxID=2910976 RepID=A0AA41QG78_9MICO|nr:PD-(D/E)XK motif protein [Antribacter soli]MCF4122076.1 PD-(D/E)XK motif protein [Antribacter soli]